MKALARLLFLSKVLSWFQGVNFEAGDAAGFVSKGVRCAGEHWESRIVHGHDVLHAEEARGKGGFARAHGKEIPDGQASEIRFVEFADEFHVSEKRGVARMVQREAAGQAHDIARRF